MGYQLRWEGNSLEQRRSRNIENVLVMQGGGVLGSFCMWCI